MTAPTVDLATLPFVPFEAKRELPAEAGIYFALAADGEVLYIGRSVNLATRWTGHHRTKQLAQLGCARLAWLTVAETDLLPGIEAALIAYYAPRLNGSDVDYGDGKERVMLRVDKDLIRRLDAALAKRAGPYKPASRNSALEVAIREHVEKLEKEAR